MTLAILVAAAVALIIQRPKHGPLSALVRWVRGTKDGTAWHYLWGCSKCLSLYTGAGVLAASHYWPWIVEPAAIVTLPYLVLTALDSLARTNIQQGA